MTVHKLGHLLVAAHFWFACYYDWNYVKIPASLIGRDNSVFSTTKLKYLTYWNALLQSVFFTICFVNDVIGTNEKYPKKMPLIRKIKDFLLPSLAFPLAMFVGVTFWGLYFIDRELVFPKVIDAFFPVWLNHLMHTNIMIFSLLELVTSHRKYPKRKVGILILSVFMLLYLIWIHYLNSVTNRWVYPILEVLNAPSRIVFFISNFVLIIGFYLLGEKINGIRWGSSLESKKK